MSAVSTVDVDGTNGHIGSLEDERKHIDELSDTPDTPFSPAEERKLVRKLDMRIMPTMALIYFFACESITCHTLCCC